MDNNFNIKKKRVSNEKQYVGLIASGLSLIILGLLFSGLGLIGFILIPVNLFLVIYSFKQKESKLNARLGLLFYTIMIAIILIMPIIF